MHRLGHEIATHSITHNDNETFWSTASVDDWAKEMAGGRLITEKFANITDNSIVGLRAPYLRDGGNYQFTMMEEQNFLYDSSITAPLQNPPLWPYTLYFRMPHKCHGNLQNCPTRPLAVWEIVMETSRIVQHVLLLSGRSSWKPPELSNTSSCCLGDRHGNLQNCPTRPLAVWEIVMETSRTVQHVLLLSG